MILTNERYERVTVGGYSYLIGYETLTQRRAEIERLESAYKAIEDSKREVKLMKAALKH